MLPMDIGDNFIDELREKDSHETCGYLGSDGNTCGLWQSAQSDRSSKLATEGKMWVDPLGKCKALNTAEWRNCREYVSGDEWWNTFRNMARKGPSGNGGGGSRERE